MEGSDNRVCFQGITLNPRKSSEAVEFEKPRESHVVLREQPQLAHSRIRLYKVSNS